MHGVQNLSPWFSVASCVGTSWCTGSWWWGCRWCIIARSSTWSQTPSLRFSASKEEQILWSLCFMLDFFALSMYQITTTVVNQALVIGEGQVKILSFLFSRFVTFSLCGNAEKGGGRETCMCDLRLWLLKNARNIYIWVVPAQVTNDENMRQHVRNCT